MQHQGEKLILGLSAMLQLGKRAFAAEDEKAFNFLVVNETHLMTPYRQAALWSDHLSGSNSIAAVSGSPDPEKRAPYITWLNKILIKQAKENTSPNPSRFNKDQLEEQLGETWDQWLPAYGLWVPLITGQGTKMGGLFIAKAVPWTNAEMKLLKKLADTYANAWESVWLRSRKPFMLWPKDKPIRKTLFKLALVAALLLAMWTPIHQTTLAPAMVVSKETFPIRSTLDGVIEKMHVQPNQTVKKGDLLFSLDKAELENQLEISYRLLSVSQAEYKQTLKMAVRDEDSRIKLKILEKQIETQQAEAQTTSIQLQRVDIRSPRDGVVIFDDANDWLGRPVMTGERVLEVADPNQLDIEINLAVGDTIALENDAKILLFPNIDPMNSLPGALYRIAYVLHETEGTLAYRLRGRFDEGVKPLRIGMRGVAKLYGRKTTLFLYIFRRPMASMRQWLGL
ncbi:MAG: HlyD family efflux transporter periplasmic adaptor subunit [Magnetococcales bacterium]|nr:HlyD family efflux transporter periplasmic adaptor subunit [Magnetococcales bacterium]